MEVLVNTYRSPPQRLGNPLNEVLHAMLIGTWQGRALAEGIFRLKIAPSLSLYRGSTLTLH